MDILLDLTDDTILSMKLSGASALLLTLDYSQHNQTQKRPKCVVKFTQYLLPAHLAFLQLHQNTSITIIIENIKRASVAIEWYFHVGDASLVRITGSYSRVSSK